MNTKKCVCLVTIATALLATPITSAQDDRRHDRRENWKHDAPEGNWYVAQEKGLYKNTARRSNRFFPALYM
jgi:hypothetical protein